MNFFNVRVYGLLIDNNQVLVSDELIKGMRITKFPGGGLEFGEGPADCVKREFIEELNLRTEIVSHFYTTDFFVPSAFNSNSQVISIYYQLAPLHALSVVAKTIPFDFDVESEGAQAFRWISLDSISENDFTFVIDKKVARLLKTKFQ